MGRHNDNHQGSIRWCCALLIVGCASRPIEDGHHEAVVTSSGRPITMSKLMHAILRAGRQENWQMRHVRHGLIVAAHTKGKYSATVEIPYHSHNFSIVYKDSANLGYKEGKINSHHN
jgi:hypothetical protein